LLYIVNPSANYPAGATNSLIPPLQGGAVVIQSFPAGRYLATWYDPRSGQATGSTAGSSDGARLVLPLPDFSEDLAGWLAGVADFSLQAPGLPGSGRFQAVLHGTAGANYLIQTSPDLQQWHDLTVVSNATGSVQVMDSTATNATRRFYRARLPQ
jgi:hypothetical protein